jgi:hypothetical protein
MPELLVLEFDGVGESQYNEVNTELGIDQATGQGNWPPGLITHIGAVAEGGNLIVVEVWQSRQAQEDFMSSRLGSALAAGGISSVPKVTWANLISQNSPGK